MARLTHIYIVGQTLSGKTTLAKAITRRVSGDRCLIFDPLSPARGRDVGGWSGHVEHDWDTFTNLFWKSRGCFVVIDEALDVFREHPEARSMLTRGRHVVDGGGGHCVCLIAQRHKGMDRTARDQASRLYAFRVAQADADDLADQWCQPGLTGASRLAAGQYMRADAMGQLTRGKIF